MLREKLRVYELRKFLMIEVFVYFVPSNEFALGTIDPKILELVQHISEQIEPTDSERYVGVRVLYDPFSQSAINEDLMKQTCQILVRDVAKYTDSKGDHITASITGFWTSSQKSYHIVIFDGNDVNYGLLGRLYDESCKYTSQNKEFSFWDISSDAHEPVSDFSDIKQMRRKERRTIEKKVGRLYKAAILIYASILIGLVIFFFKDILFLFKLFFSAWNWLRVIGAGLVTYFLIIFASKLEEKGEPLETILKDNM